MGDGGETGRPQRLGQGRGLVSRNRTPHQQNSQLLPGQYTTCVVPLRGRFYVCMYFGVDKSRFQSSHNSLSPYYDVCVYYIYICECIK